MVFSSIALSKIGTATIKICDYDPAKDRQKVLAICEQHHKAYGECKACGGLFLSLLYTLAFRNDLNIWIKILKEDATVMGFIIYNEFIPHSLLPASIRSLFTKLNAAELSYIGIDQKYQGKGYGHRLFNVALRDLSARGYSTILANVSDENESAMKWHEKEGFICIPESDAIVDFYRVQSKAGNYVSYMYRINNDVDSPHLLIAGSEISRHELNAQLEDHMKKGLAKNQAQCLIAEKAAHKIHRPLTHSFYDKLNLARIFEYYLRESLDRDKVDALVVFLLGIDRELIIKRLNDDLSFFLDHAEELQHAVIKENNMSLICNDEECYVTQSKKMVENQ